MSFQSLKLELVKANNVSLKFGPDNRNPEEEEKIGNESLNENNSDNSLELRNSLSDDEEKGLSPLIGIVNELPQTQDEDIND